MRVLFVTSSRIGDCVLSTGLLDHLIRRYPRARITVVCGPIAAGLFAHMPNLERLIPLEKYRLHLHWFRLWLMTARTAWDLVVDIRGSALGFFLWTRKRAIMRSRPGRKVAQLGQLLGLEPPPLPVVWTSAQDRALAAALLPPGPPIVALAPTANWPGKIWPAGRFCEFFRLLQRGSFGPARAVVFAGPGPFERALAEPVLAELPDAVALCGSLNLSEAAACLARAALFIGNDSGLMHIAAAAGTPTLGLFGPTPATDYGPAGPMAVAVRSPTSRMDDLSVSLALTAAETLLQRATAA